MSLTFAATSLEALLHSSGAGIPSSNVISNITPYIQTLCHFENLTYTTLGSSIVQAVIHTSNLKHATSYPYLMHATLALSATHLKHLLPASNNPKLHRQHALTEAYHWQRALHLFRMELDSPVGLDGHNMDPIISTSMLLSRVSFAAPPDSGSSQSFINTTSLTQTTTALNWLTVQSGVKPLLIAFRPHIPTSLWFPVFVDSDNGIGTFFDERPGSAGMPTLLAQLCDIDANSTISSNPYHAPLRLLAPLLRIEAGISTFGKLITFMGRISIEFQLLLRQKDARACLILAYWLAMMAQVNQWWIVGRAKSECMAICTYLRDEPDARIRTLLEFPTGLCGLRVV